MHIRFQLALVCGLTLATAPAFSSEQEIDTALAEAITRAAIDRIDRGDSTAISTLQLLLDLPDPWREPILYLAENSTLPAALRRLTANAQSATAAPAAAVLRDLATAQGAAERGTPRHVKTGEKSVKFDFADSTTQWLQLKVSADRRELMIHTDACTPDITAFNSSDSLPARPTIGLARYNHGLASVPADEGTLLRVRPGDCDAGEVTLSLEWREMRRALTDGGKHSPVRVIPGVVTTLSLAKRLAQPFLLATEPGKTYAVYAASIDPEADPGLLRVDRVDPAITSDEDDDGGWRYGARLGTFVGTGVEEKFSATRVGRGGTVALLVERQEIPVLASGTRISVPAGEPAWRRIRLETGHWHLRAQEVSADFDPAMEILDAATGASLGLNDDSGEENVAPAVKFQLEKPTDIVIKLVSVNETAGTLTLVAERSKRAATRLGSSTSAVILMRAQLSAR